MGQIVSTQCRIMAWDKEQRTEQLRKLGMVNTTYIFHHSRILIRAICQTASQSGPLNRATLL
jgi:hypothetical protein